MKEGKKKPIRMTQSSSAQPEFARSSSGAATRHEIFSSAMGTRAATGQMAWQNHARYYKGIFCRWLGAGSLFGKVC